MIAQHYADVDLAERLRGVEERAAQLERLERSHQDVTGPDLGLAEEQRGVVPAAIQRIDDPVGDARHLGLVAAKPVYHLDDVAEHAGAIEPEMIGGEANIGLLLLQDVE